MRSQKRALAQLKEFNRGSNEEDLGRGVFAVVTSKKRICSSMTRTDSNYSANTARINIGDAFQAVIPELTCDSKDRGDVCIFKLD